MATNNLSNPLIQLIPTAKKHYLCGSTAIMSIYTAWFKFKGWEFDTASMTEEAHNCVMIAAPHTSNWDLMYMMGSFGLLGIKIRFTIKNEWQNTPIISRIIENLGAIWIDRSPKIGSTERKSMTEAMVDLFRANPRLTLVVTPEGTRAKRTEWKTGFYHVAVQAGVPIGLGYLDYKKKKAGVGKFIHPSGDMEKDLREIMAFYKTIHPRHPKDFSVDLRYS
ncbi:lysophospholipid acyltransferase family protein [soil metagenome]